MRGQEQTCLIKKQISLGIDASNIRGGGGVTHLIELLHGADTFNHGFGQVFVWGGRRTLSKLEDRPGLCKVHEPLLDQALPLRCYWQRFILHRRARSTGCDILFVPGGSYGGVFRPFVTMSQNMLPFEPSEAHRFGFSWPRLRYRLLYQAQSATLRRAQGVIFLSDYARSIVTRSLKGRIAREAVIPHGVDRRFFRQPPEQKAITDYSKQNPFRFLYVSIINFYKHQWHVAEAVAHLRQSGLPIEIDFVGPAYPPALRKLKDTIGSLDPGGEYLHYVGPVPYEQLHDFYHQADAFVFASSCENLPNIMLEAMASGLPIASSNRGPMPEVLGDGGVYPDPEKLSEIADSLRKIISNPGLRSKLAHEAFDRAKQYSWNRCAEQTFKFLAQIHRESRRSERPGLS
jgi:glycosyltransferase involved in cell wall biosynthesis